MRPEGGSEVGEGSIGSVIVCQIYRIIKSSKPSLSCPHLLSSHSVTNLLPSFPPSPPPPKTGYEGLFDGEIFTRAFSPLLAIGALSPRYLASLLPSLPPSFPFFLLDKATKNAAMVKEVLERREWHQVLAERDVVHFPLPETEALEFKYWRFHGHNVRYAVSRVDARGAKEGGKEGGREEDEVPTLLLVHGFGASSDQWSKCFEALSELTITDKKLQNGFRVFALDLLGFGHSEKPSVTYTQYLWQDQVRDFALEVVKSPFFIAGNSIGGFTAASVAADIGPMCQGLILVNTAGKVVSPEVSLQSGGSSRLCALF